MMNIAKILNIGEQIKAARKIAGLTQKQLSEKSGVHEVQLRRYECNQAVPREYQISRIAKAIGIKSDDIFSQKKYEEIVRLGMAEYKRIYGD